MLILLLDYQPEDAEKSRAVVNVVIKNKNNKTIKK